MSESKAKKRKPEMVRIVIYGSHDGTEQIIREFYLCRFSSPTEWSLPIALPNNPHEVMRTYTRRLRQTVCPALTRNYSRRSKSLSAKERARILKCGSNIC